MGEVRGFPTMASASALPNLIQSHGLRLGVLLQVGRQVGPTSLISLWGTSAQAKNLSGIAIAHLPKVQTLVTAIQLQGFALN